jgi:hypothetical protein
MQMNQVQTTRPAIHESNPAYRAAFMRITRTLSSDSCGCAMGAFTLAAGLILASSWYALHWRFYALSFRAVSLRVLLWVFLSACAGKLLGIALFRLRTKKRFSFLS